MSETRDLLDIKQASLWATEHIGKTVTPSNIAYLINYGRILKNGDNGGTLIAKQDLLDYYESQNREKNWKKQLGDDLNWALSFDQYKESETTKHVHRLHPYKGIANVLNNCKKFLVEDFDIFLVANDKYNLYPHLN